MSVTVHPIAAPWGRFALYSFLIDAPEPALVDTGVTESAKGVPAALEALGKRVEDLRWILLTHGHIDHVGGAFALWEATGRKAEVVISELDAPFLRSRAAHVEEFRSLRGEYFPDVEAAAAAKTAETEIAISGEMEPTRLVRDGDRLDLGGGVRIAIHAIPGHTPGAIAYQIEGQNDVFIGDAAQCYGAASGFPGYENPDEYRASLERLLALAPKHLYLGHPYRRADGTPFPIELGEADATEALQGSLANEARIRAAFTRHAGRAGHADPADHAGQTGQTDHGDHADPAGHADYAGQAGQTDHGDHVGRLRSTDRADSVGEVVGDSPWRAVGGNASDEVSDDSPYAPFAAVAAELGYTGDPTLEPAPFFTTMHGYATLLESAAQ